MWWIFSLIISLFRRQSNNWFYLIYIFIIKICLILMIFYLMQRWWRKAICTWKHISIYIFPTGIPTAWYRSIRGGHQILDLEDQSTYNLAKFFMLSNNRECFQINLCHPWSINMSSLPKDIQYPKIHYNIISSMFFDKNWVIS